MKSNVNMIYKNIDWSGWKVGKTCSGVKDIEKESESELEMSADQNTGGDRWRWKGESQTK